MFVFLSMNDSASAYEIKRLRVQKVEMETSMIFQLRIRFAFQIFIWLICLAYLRLHVEHVWSLDLMISTGCQHGVTHLRRPKAPGKHLKISLIKAPQDSYVFDFSLELEAKQMFSVSNAL